MNYVLQQKFLKNNKEFKNNKEVVMQSQNFSQIVI